MSFDKIFDLTARLYFNFYNNLFQTFPMSILKTTLPGIPRKWNRLDVDRSARISGCYPAISGEEGVTRLSLGRLLVNLLQVVKQTSTSLIPQQMGPGVPTGRHEFLRRTQRHGILLIFSLCYYLDLCANGS